MLLPLHCQCTFEPLKAGGGAAAAGCGSTAAITLNSGCTAELTPRYQMAWPCTTLASTANYWKCTLLALQSPRISKASRPDGGAGKRRQAGALPPPRGFQLPPPPRDNDLNEVELHRPSSVHSGRPPGHSSPGGLVSSLKAARAPPRALQHSRAHAKLGGSSCGRAKCRFCILAAELAPHALLFGIGGLPTR